MFFKKFGWAVLVGMTVCGTIGVSRSAVADVAAPLEDYLHCQNEAALTEGRSCIQCLGTDLKDYENETSWPLCSLRSSQFASDNYEKVCQSETYQDVWSEIWCKILDTDSTSDGDPEDSSSEVEKETDNDAGQSVDDTEATTDDTDTKPVDKKESSSGCSVAKVGVSTFGEKVATLLRFILGL